MMAGNVIASLQSGTLRITGDKLDNGISIVGSAVPGEFVIQGLQTRYGATTVNGKRSFTVEHVKNITIDLKAGDDVLRVGDAGGDLTPIPGALTVYGSPGNKTVTLRNVSVGDIASVTTGAGNDSVTVKDLKVGGKVSLTTGAGNDVVTIDNLTAKNPTAKKDLALDSGTGNDTVKIVDSWFRDLSVNLGGGDDGLLFTGNRADGTCNLNGGAGRDAVESRNSAFRNLSVNLGGGDDVLLSTGDTVSGTAVLDGGAGKDSLNENWRKVNSGNISVVKFEVFC